MSRLLEPRLTRIYRLDAALGEPLDLGDVSLGHRRIVPLTGGVPTGPELDGKLLPSASADFFISVGGRRQGGEIHEAHLVA